MRRARPRLYVDKAPVSHHHLPLAPALLAAALCASVGCADECTVAIDCASEDSFAVCVDGACVATEADLGDPCGGDADCPTDVGVRRCVGGHCAYLPPCQIVEGPFVAVTDCVGTSHELLPARAATDACQTTFSMQIRADDAATPVGVAEIPSAPEVGVSLAAIDTCSSGTWSAAEGVADLRGCTVEGATCDTVFVAEVLDETVCIVGEAGCPEGTSCEALAGHAPAGVCR